MQNINIVYKVDKTQVDASTASVNQAKAATDQLTASAAKLGQQGSKNTIQFGNTIEGVKLKIAQLRGQIDLTNQADKKRLDGLIVQYKAAQKQLEQYTSKLKENASSANAAASSGNSFAGSLGNIYSAIKLIIGAQLVKQFVSLSIEAAELSGKVEGIERAFKRAFPNSVLILNDLRKATKGTITDFELMQRTLQATNLGVAVEQLPILFEFAAARAQQTGESVDYLVDSIVRGIGRKSLLVLDNLGLSAVRLKEQFNGASLASQSVGDVTKAVARIAQEELDKMGGYLETNATRVDRLKVSWTNLGIEISKLVSGEGGIITFFQGYVSAFGTLFEAMNKNISVSELLRQKHIQEVAASEVNIIKLRELTGERKHDVQMIKEVIAEKIHELLQMQEEGKQLDENLKKANAARNESIFNTSVRLKNIEARQKDIDQSKTQQQLLIEEIKILKGLSASLAAVTVEEVEQTGIISRKREEIKALQEQIELTNKSSDIGVGGKLIEQLEKAQEELDVLLGKLESLRKAPPEMKMVVDLKFKDPETGKLTEKGHADFLNKFLSDLQIDLDKKPIVIPVTLPEEAPKFQPGFFDDLGDAFKANWKSIVNDVVDIQTDFIVGVLDSEVRAYDQRILNTERFYDKQIELAGDNDNRKKNIEEKRQKDIEKLRKEQFRKEKSAAKATAVINAAGAAVRAFVDYQYPYSLIVAALAAGAAAVEIDQINKQQPGFKDGVINIKGPGTSTSDSIPSMLSRGESVMTAKETQESGRTLQMIRAKKINDKVLDRIISKGQSGGKAIGFDDSRLLKASEKIARAASGNDIVRKGAIIYEAKQEGDSLKSYIRSKSLN